MTIPACEICGSKDRVQRVTLRPLRTLQVKGQKMIALAVRPWLCDTHRRRALARRQEEKVPKNHNQEPLF